MHTFIFLLNKENVKNKEWGGKYNHIQFPEYQNTIIALIIQLNLALLPVNLFQMFNTSIWACLPTRYMSPIHCN